MADAVSKLYAEIGFKVDTKGLQEVKSLLEELAKNATNLNKTAQQAAEKDNILSKKKIQQRRLSISEQLKQNREQEKLFKEITNSEEREYKERLKQEEKFEKERDRRRREAIKNLRDFAKTSVNIASGIMAYGTLAVKESIGRARDFSKLQLFTGISSSDYGKFAERAFATNSGMSQEDVMRDIQNVSSNLQKIALGQGSLGGYKLSGVVASARYGDVAGVIRNFENAIRGGGILPNMALEVGQQIGLSRDWIYSMIKGGGSGSSQIQISQTQRNAIEKTGENFSLLNYEIQQFKDSIVATLSPALQSGATGFRTALKMLADSFEENKESYNELIKSLSDSINGFIKSLKKEDIGDFVKTVKMAASGLEVFAMILKGIGMLYKWPETVYNWVLSKLKGSGSTIDTDNPQEAMKHIMLGDSAWNEGISPVKENRSGNVYSQANEINVTVESKTENPYEEGRVVGGAVKSAMSEKLNFAHNSTFLAGNEWG